MKFLALPPCTVQFLNQCLHSFVAYKEDKEYQLDCQLLDPLAYAVYNGDEKMVEELLEQQMYLETCWYIWKYSPIAVALKCQQFKVLTVLLQSYQKTTFTLKRRRISTGSVGHSVDFLCSVLSHCRHKNLRHNVMLHLMYWAIVRHNTSVVGDLLGLGVGVNEPLDGESFLHVATKSDDLSIARLLLRNGAYVNARDALEETPLLRAVRLNSLPMTKLLIDIGADVNSRNDDRQTPLHIAAASCYNSNELVKLLLSSGARFDATDHDGYTPLARSLSNFLLRPTFSTVKSLVRHGSYPVRLKELEALDWAFVKSQNYDIILFLNRAGLPHILHSLTTTDADRLAVLRLKTFLLKRTNTLSNINDIKCKRLASYRSSEPMRLYNACHLTIRIHLARISNGRSIYRRIQALPLPELIRQDLFLEE